MVPTVSTQATRRTCRHPWATSRYRVAYCGRYGEWGYLRPDENFEAANSLPKRLSTGKV